MFFSSECDKIGKQLWGHANGSLSHSDLARVENHLRGCEACRREAESYRQTVNLMSHLRQEAVPASRKGWRDLQARLEAEASTQRRSLFPLFVWSGGLMTAAAMLFLVVAPRVHSVQSLSPTPPEHQALVGHPNDSQTMQSRGQVALLDPDDEVLSLPPSSTNVGSELSTHSYVHAFQRHDHGPPPIARYVVHTNHNALTVVGRTPKGWPKAMHLADTLSAEPQNVDGGQQIRRADYVMPPVATAEEDGQDPHYVIDTVSSTSPTATIASSDGTEEQHPW